MFESARLKLTLFYLAALLVLSLTLTLGLRAMTQAEVYRAGDAQRGIFHSIGQQFFDNSNPEPVDPDRAFAQAQRNQNHLTLTRLTRETILLNVGTLVIGAVASYWFAGRTLRPIEEAHERQKRFASDASHELRTPLTSMRVENEVFLRQKGFSEADARAQFASNLEEIDRLERLASNLLSLSRYEDAVLPRKALDAAALAAAAIDRTKQTGKVKFDNQVAHQSVLGDRESLVELLGILLDNAVKYGPADGTVYLASAVRGQDYVLSVRDEGPGIAAKDLPHIFERLYRADAARNSATGGHGIGLSLAQEIASANGARLEATNRSGGGAIFSVTLPRA